MRTENFALVAVMGTSGVLNTVLNKYLVSNLRLRAKFLILTIQTCMVLLILFLMNIAFFRYKVSIKKDVLKYWIYIALSLISMIYSGLQASEYLPISLFTVLKNGTIPIVVLHDWMFFDYHINMLTVCSFFLVGLSSFIGTMSNTKSNTIKPGGISAKRQKAITALGLLWMAINCLSSAAYSIRISVTIKEQKTPSVVASIYTNMLALPFLIALSLVESVSSKPPKTHIHWILLSGITSCLISVTTAWAASVFTTTSMTIVAALNKTPMAISGVLFGIEEVGSRYKWISVAVGILSAFLYAVSRSPYVDSKPVVE